MKSTRSPTLTCLEIRIGHTDEGSPVWPKRCYSLQADTKGCGKVTAKLAVP
jgi:hypothetical protein